MANKTKKQTNFATLYCSVLKVKICYAWDTIVRKYFTLLLHYKNTFWLTAMLILWDINITIIGCHSR